MVRIVPAPSASELKASPQVHIAAGIGALIFASANWLNPVFWVRSDLLTTNLLVAGGTYVVFLIILRRNTVRAGENVFLCLGDRRTFWVSAAASLALIVPVFLVCAVFYFWARHEYFSTAGAAFLLLFKGISAFKIFWFAGTTRPAVILREESVVQGGYLFGGEKNWKGALPWTEIGEAAVRESAHELVLLGKEGQELSRISNLNGFPRRAALLQGVAERLGRPLSSRAD